MEKRFYWREYVINNNLSQGNRLVAYHRNISSRYNLDVTKKKIFMNFRIIYITNLLLFLMFSEVLITQ